MIWARKVKYRSLSISVEKNYRNIFIFDSKTTAIKKNAACSLFYLISNIFTPSESSLSAVFTGMYKIELYIPGRYRVVQRHFRACIVAIVMFALKVN